MNLRLGASTLAMAFAVVLGAAPATAQSSADSAVENAEDAFGTSTNHENIGGTVPKKLWPCIWQRTAFLLLKARGLVVVGQTLRELWELIGRLKLVQIFPLVPLLNN